MFNKEKYNKSNQSLNHAGISKNIISSNKYHQRTYQKVKKQTQKKNGCNRLWKKQSSYNYWIDKENDNNSQNYNYNKKFYFDKKKSFKFQKKISYSELDDEPFITNMKKEEKNDKNENKKKIKEEDYDSKEDAYKDEKCNSIEYTISTAYSNSISAHEESNNIQNSHENLNNEEFRFNMKNSSQSDNSNLYAFNTEKNQFIPNTKINEVNESNHMNKSEQINDINYHYFSNSTKNLNLIRLNSCQNTNNEISSFSSHEIPKVKSINKFSENSSTEPFNKYNTINQDINQFWVNPIAENTEILRVNVKISKNKSAIFKLRRFDDLFLTVKLFCEINSIEEKLMKPIIIKSLCALNNIYQVFNTQIDEKNIKRLKVIKNFISNTYI